MFRGAILCIARDNRKNRIINMVCCDIVAFFIECFVNVTEC